jgi:proteasome lid subunit RPN8/RPN11
MAGAALAPEFRVWEAPGHSVRIEYAREVMDQIRMAAVDGYHLVPHGGVETGGILFGTHKNDVVRIAAWRPIPCEYATGPSFVLSETDRAALQEALQAAAGDAELAGLEPVGWYHSHTRSEIFLSEQDLDVFREFFPQPWQVALVLRPASFAPTRAGFFFREASGEVHARNSYCEFELTPSGPPAAGPAAEETPRAPQAAPARLEPKPPAAQPRRRARWKWYAAGLVLVLAVAFGLWKFNAPVPRLSLSVTDTGGQLHIAWDRSAGPVRNAVRGSLEIQDHGVRTEISLAPADLRSGSISYARRSGDVLVRLTVEPREGSPVQEVHRFLKPVQSAAAPPPAPAQPQPDPAKQALEREAEAMRARIEQQKTELDKLERMVGTMRQSPPAAPKPVTSAPPHSASTARMETAHPPGQSEMKPEVPPAHVAEAALRPKTETVQPAPARVEPPVQTAAATPPPVTSAHVTAAPLPKVPPPPASGRMIWTGKLSKNGRLVIDGNRASIGSLTGALPGRAARVTAYPGDFTDQGITLFTADTKYAHPLIEAAGAQNGWNLTTYTWDPKRAAGIRILEQPSPQNGYKLVLQSVTSKLPILVMEWHAAQ